MGSSGALVAPAYATKARSSIWEPLSSATGQHSVLGMVAPYMAAACLLSGIARVVAFTVWW